MQITKDKLLEILNDNNVHVDEAELSQMYDNARGVDGTFLEYFLKYHRMPLSKTDEHRLKGITPMPLYQALVRCPLMLKHYHDKRIAKFRGNPERDILLSLLADNAYKNISDLEFQEYLESEELSVSSEVYHKAFSYMEVLMKKESTERRSAKMELDETLAIVDTNGHSPLITYKNHLTLRGAHNDHVFFIKVIKGTFSESYLKIFEESMFMTALAALSQSEGKKNIKVNLLLLLEDDMLVPVRWHIPADFTERMQVHPGEIAKKFILDGFKNLPEDFLEDTERLKQLSSKSRFCDFCGYQWLKEETFNKDFSTEESANDKKKD